MQRTIPALVVMLLGAPAIAQHAAHVHGAGQLNLAVEGELLSIDLTVPANDLVGFEHQPSSDEDRAAIEKAHESLEDAAALLGVPAAAGCTLDKVEIHSALLGEDHEEDHDHEKHAEKDEDHDQEKQGDHDEAAHSEFRAEYRFTCAAPGELTALVPSYFRIFPRAEVLKVQGITEKGQILVDLTRDNPQLKLSD